MKFTKDEFDRFRKECDNALAPLGKAYALSIHASGITYNENKFTVKLECAKTDAGDIPKLEFEKNCEQFGFSADDYQREFVAYGDKYMLVGFSPNSRKYSAICRKADNGKEYKLPAGAVKNAFKKQ